MAKGDVTYLLTGFEVDRTGASVRVRGNATKYVEDEDGTKQSIGSWVGSLSYATAGFGAKTVTQLNADLITEIKAKNAAVSAKTIS